MIRYRTATEAEVSTVLDWAADEGWNPGIDDAAAFVAADPGGFFVAEADGAPVAAISVVNHSPEFAFLGLYIVRPDYRGRGIGLALWHHAVDHAETRIIGLDGVPDQQSNYAASGFERAGSTTRYSGDVGTQVDPEARLAKPEDLARLIELEAEASGIAKPAYMAAWFTNTSNRVTFGSPNGLVTIRRCRVGAKIGPLVAADNGVALRLIRHAAGAFDGPVILDVPAQSAPLARLCTAQGMIPSFETARMYRGGRITGSGTVYAVASLELG